MAPITHANYRTASLDEWQMAFWRLYGHKDDETPLFDLLLQMVADATRLAEAVRKQKAAEALPYIPRVFTWLANMITKCANDPSLYGDLSSTASLSRIVWNKYPRLCSLCAEPRCMCPFLALDPDSKAAVLEGERSSRLKHARSQTDRMPATLDSWAGMFDQIYGIPHARLPLAEKTLHFFEEVGEVEVELRKWDRLAANIIPPGREEEYSKIEFEDEIADVFSWLISMFIDIAEALKRANDFMETFREKRRHAPTGKREFDPPTFSEWLWVEFGDPQTGTLRCHVCHQPKCECKVKVTRR